MEHFEIERKFLVKGDFRAQAVGSHRMAQAYISVTPRHTVRVRRSDDRSFLTIKGKGVNGGMVRPEFEWEITSEEADGLFQLAESGTVHKIRHLVPNTDGKHTWEVDEFLVENQGLVVAEIELSAPDETFDRPDWLGEEVTGDHRYSNSWLSVHPFTTW